MASSHRAMRRVKVWKICAAMGMAIALGSCAPRRAEPLVYTGYLKEPPKIRVSLVNGAQEVRIAVGAPFEGRDLESGELLIQGIGLNETVARAGSRGMVLGNTELTSRRVRLSTAQDASISLNGSPYRGDMLLLEAKPGAITVVNELAMEEYLAGVIGSEMPLTWPKAALQAQAIAARTFAVYLVKTSSPDAEYHFRAGGRFSQEYRGVANELPLARQIVHDTRGVIMVYDWQVFPAFYHSVSGGHTRNVKDMFDLNSIPPLMGVQDPFSRGSKYDSWQSSMPLSELEGSLKAAGKNVGTVASVLASRAPSGAYIVEITHSKGKTQLPAQEFRLAVGPNVVRSPEFEARIDGGTITFSGHGWGHGVGMCQWGAKVMAESRHDAIGILNYYYPGSDVVRIY